MRSLIHNNYCHTLNLLAVSLVWLLCPSTTMAASFDCAKAGTMIEKLICGDFELSKLDEELGKVYSVARNKASDPLVLKQHQRTWLKERNKRCKSVSCLSIMYRERINQLTISHENPSLSAIVLPLDISAQENTFSPISKACWGVPGSIFITPNTITSNECSDTPYSVVRNIQKKDGYWGGIDKKREIKDYRDLVLHIDRNKHCLADSETSQQYVNEVFRFVIEGSSAKFMAYRTLEDLYENNANVWCAYTFIEKP